MKVVYPGSFDPVTNGHVDIIKRCARQFDEVCVAILNNLDKKHMFTVEERIEFIEKVFADYDNISVTSFDGLLVDFVEREQCNIIIKGLRAVSDYEYELQMALANSKLNDAIETLFMVSKGEFSFLSSSLVKEIANFGGSVVDLVPKCVNDAIIKKVKEK